MASKKMEGFLKTIRHPKTKAQMALSAFLLILFAALVIMITALFRHPEVLSDDPGDQSALVMESGQAQLLDSFTKAPMLPETVSSIRLDGIFIQQTGDSYATFSVDGVTATMVEDDYVGGYQIYDITSEGVTLRKDGEKITLTMTENKLDITDEEE